jgi:hypothetical protein
MFNQFRMHYPKGSLVTELAAIDHGKYIVRCLVQVEGTSLATALAAAETVELAEDRARSRALALLGISATTITAEQEIPVANREVPQPPMPTSVAAPAFSSETVHPTQSPQFPEPSIVTDTSRFPSFDSNREEVASVAVTASWGADEMTLANEASPEVSISQDVEKPLWRAPEESSPTPLEDTPVTSSTQSTRKRKPEVDTSKTTAPDTPVDFSDIIARTNVELKRLGWTTQQGKDYLLQTYGKRSRQLLTDGELLDFLHHLESEPTPED